MFYDIFKYIHINLYHNFKNFRQKFSFYTSHEFVIILMLFECLFSKIKIYIFYE
jgi:hypothetical protein